MAWIIFAVVIAALIWWALKVDNGTDGEAPRHTELGGAWFKSEAQNLRDGLLGWSIGWGIPLGYQRFYTKPPDAIVWKAGSSRLEQIRYAGPNALILVAPPRSGKFRDIECAALLEYGLGRPAKDWPYLGPGWSTWDKEGNTPNISSCIVIDPKGQAAATTAPHRARMGQRIIMLNPFHIWPDHLGPNNPYFDAWPPVMGPRPKDFEGGSKRCIFDGHYNPMPIAGTPRFAEDCMKRADACVVRDDHASGDSKYFYDKAKYLIAGLIAEVAEGFPPELRSLAQVAEIVADGYEAIAAVARASLQRGPSDFIKRALTQYTRLNAQNIKEVECIVSTAQGQMAFINSSPHISENLSGTSSFEWAELKRIPTTVYLILPLDEMETSKKWFRLVIESASAALMSESTDGPYSTLMILDEFVQLGHLDIMTTVMNAGAGRGLRAWPIIQNLPDLEALYGKKYLSFLSSCGVQVFFAPRDPVTADYIQKKSGLQTIVVPSQSTSYSDQGNGQYTFNVSNSKALHQMPLVPAHEASQMANENFLMFDESGKMTYGERMPYYRDLLYQQFWAAPDPNEKGSAQHPFWHVPWPSKAG